MPPSLARLVTKAFAMIAQGVAATARSRTPSKPARASATQSLRNARAIRHESSRCLNRVADLVDSLIHALVPLATSTPVMLDIRLTSASAHDIAPAGCS